MAAWAESSHRRRSLESVIGLREGYTHDTVGKYPRRVALAKGCCGARISGIDSSVMEATARLRTLENRNTGS